ncbi:hypothetical protein DUNSADRAFT_7083 [Dunaliella salina]|uniref:Transcriptional regulator n=1 Tax=Dunaliella salina TaxID=3046 RepID=A0ABQ7H6K1_DUNSA|nr:hypothetical protein DUNSADRAFT_7083 [Dunaliella salina]|eukprot:KAF5842473.1 hypothetical protein DUNSADRAFT_7083 [Dunaliella salina]
MMLKQQGINPKARELTQVCGRHIDRISGLAGACSTGEQPEGSPQTSPIPDSIPALRPDTDWREFRARLVGRTSTDNLSSQAEPSTLESQLSHESLHWAHSIPAPEKGCLLLAHPLVFQERQKYFHQAAILILEHNEMGSYGLILNQPSVHTLGDLSLTQPLDEFKDCPLYLGGDVGGGEVHMIHPYNLPRSVEIVKGVYLGGIEAAAKMVARKEADVKDFKWYARYAGWGPKQLERECKAGVWFTAAASAPLILSRPEGSASTLWHNVLQLMGGDYQELSINVRAQEERWKK